ncbi:MAG TPA: phosphoribosyltransferase [Jatrophihabitantaceae bacterium]|nr:phosphoribosyltransferase [Jatrophihabitantaceae bacterium]
MTTVRVPTPPAAAMPVVASTQWVAERLGARLEDLGGPEHIESLVGLGIRRNPRRAHLLVSSVLGKHVPVEPDRVYDTAARLGRLVADRVRGAVCVIGYAETATALGHVVADVLAAPYVHSTRRTVRGAEVLATFEEEHSHATAHRLLPDDPAIFATADTVVLVDDELSTGRTAMNTITALHSPGTHRRYVVAALVDVRSAEDERALLQFAERLRIDIDVVALARGRLSLPAGFVQSAADVAAVRQDAETRLVRDCRVNPARWHSTVREGGRHGFTARHRGQAHAAASDCARGLAPAILGPDVLVLGSEELMYAPLLIARALVDVLGDRCRVRFSSTTRSPVLAIDEPGYPVRTRIAFPAHDGTDQSPRFAYNVAPATGNAPCNDIVLVVDTAGDSDQLRTPDGALAALSAVAERVHLIVVPSSSPVARSGPPPGPLRGPAFGSYRADDVGWLLTDISDAPLERPIEEREEAVQSAAAHYSESLPVEYQPSAAYLDVFHRAVRENVTQVAEAVGVLTEVILAERGRHVVLASLARAGSPIGILLRRWAHFAHGVDLPHYAVSIVRGRGLDMEALRFLAGRHDSRDVVFVDGWTGKGAIVRELVSAIPSCNAALGTHFAPELAVLADTGHCVSTFGTRADFLIPSACLNSTVSGLVSRTVLNRDVLGPHDYHGAKYYRSLAAADVSQYFLNAVTEQFPHVAEVVERRWREVQAGPRLPDWSGWAAVEAIAAEHGVTDLNLVKPGIGETTRVLLRRVPWRVLVRPDALSQLEHVVLLAADRGAEVVEVPELAFSCVGLIRPRRAAQ